MPSLGFQKKELTGPHPKTRGINLLLGSTAMGEASSFSAGAHGPHGPRGRRHRALGRELGAAFEAVPACWRTLSSHRLAPSPRRTCHPILFSLNVESA